MYWCISVHLWLFLYLLFLFCICVCGIWNPNRQRFCAFALRSFFIHFHFVKNTANMLQYVCACVYTIPGMCVMLIITEVSVVLHHISFSRNKVCAHCLVLWETPLLHLWSSAERIARARPPPSTHTPLIKNLGWAWQCAEKLAALRWLRGQLMLVWSLSSPWSPFSLFNNILSLSRSPKHDVMMSVSIKSSLTTASSTYVIVEKCFEPRLLYYSYACQSPGANLITRNSIYHPLWKIAILPLCLEYVS